MQASPSPSNSPATLRESQQPKMFKLARDVLQMEKELESTKMQLNNVVKENAALKEELIQLKGMMNIFEDVDQSLVSPTKV